MKYVQQENFWIGPSSVSASPRRPRPSMAQPCPGQNLVWESVFPWASAETLPPFQEALIHLGAKFAPCMRQDQQVQSFISAAREKEKHSACCVRNDKSGCVQTAEEECSVSSAHDFFLPTGLSPVFVGERAPFGDPAPAHFCPSALQSTLAVWVKWPSHPSTPLLAGGKRKFGSVCHQDPR